MDSSSCKTQNQAAYVVAIYCTALDPKRILLNTAKLLISSIKCHERHEIDQPPNELPNQLATLTRPAVPLNMAAIKQWLLDYPQLWKI